MADLRRAIPSGPGLFSNLKLRTSYGLTGNQAVGIYQTLPTLAATSVVFGGVETPAYVSDRLPNPDLKWETTRQLDIGLEAGFLGGRVQLEMDYYNTQTDDLLLEVEIPTQSGYSSRLENIGQIENEGFEVALDALVADARDFAWEFNANISTNRNRVVDLGDKDEVITYVYPHGTQPMGLLREGEPIGSFYGAVYEGTWKSQDEIDRVGTMPTSTPGSPRFKDLDGDGTFGQDDYTAIGNANPKFFGGLGSTFRYKDAEINFFFQGQYGGEIMNGGTPFFGATHPYTNQFRRATERWSSENPDSDVPGIQPDARPRYVATDLWLHDATHLRLKTLRVAYSLPVTQLGISEVTRSARIYVMGTNLWIWDTYDDGYDPEVSGFGTSSVNRGYDFTEYPRARSVTVGVQLGF